MLLAKENTYSKKTDVEDQFNENSKKQEMKDKIVFKKIETFISNKIEKILGEEMEKLKESLKIDLSHQISLKSDDKMISNLNNQLSDVKLEFLTIKEDINNLKNSNENNLIATESNMILNFDSIYDINVN